MMGIPQIIYLFLTAMGLGLILANDGKSQPPYSFVRSLVSNAIILSLLWWGGFFNG